MNTVLCLTLRFLDPVPQFHGRSDDGKPEWPPSPLRLFQALLYAAGNRWRDNQFRDFALPALQWLEQVQPSVIAPSTAVDSFGYRMYVPNNSGDLMTAAWARGDTETSMAKFRVEKDVRPTNLNGDVIRFLFPLSNGVCSHFEALQAITRSVTHLGWGIDMVAGNAELLTAAEVAELKGEVWQPAQDSKGTPLRVPIAGTLDALISKHHAFLGRISPDGFKPVPPLSAFRVVGYRRATEPPQRQFAAFSILKPDASAMRSFDTLRRARDVAGMTRHAVAIAAHDQGWTEERINVFVHGKTPEGSKPPNGQDCPDRFQYLPLPTINHALKRVESIRRVLIAAPPHCGQQIAWARRTMAGAELVNQDDVAALLTILPGSDWVLRQYVEESRTWSTVTPVILPGYDDPDHLRRKLKECRDAETQKRYLARLDARMEELLRKAFRQAGYSRELIEQTQLEWREVGFRAGTEPASRYLPPENLNNVPRIHVRVRFPSEVRGPVAVGSGRFRGFGLFAKAED
ncbi:MAG: cas5u6u [Planctomycetaceae bacterium]|nr:cas5u6u [Planctomycetaceae bacterium]